MKEHSDVGTFPLIDHMPRWLRKPVYGTVAALGLGSAAALGAVCESSSSQQKSSDLQRKLEYSLNLPFAPEETWWYTGGPHSYGKSSVRSGVDFAPTESPIKCDGNAHVYKQKPVRAIDDGVVEVVGNENDPNDKNHSIVKIDHGNGFETISMHLSDIEVSVGEQVNKGDPLGFASCEAPVDGSATGLHLHLEALYLNKPIEVDSLVMSGWTLEAGKDNYDGVAKMTGEEIRTANVGRCGPDVKSIDMCGGIRNDISWLDLGTIDMPRVGAATYVVPIKTPQATSSPLAVETPTPIVMSTPTVPEVNLTRDQLIQIKMDEAEGKMAVFMGFMLSGQEGDFKNVLALQTPPELQNKYQKEFNPDYYKLMTIEELAACSREMRDGGLSVLDYKIIRIPRVESVPGEEKPDNYAVSVAFNFRNWNYSTDRRNTTIKAYNHEGFRHSLVFEDVGGKLYVNQVDICKDSATEIKYAR